MNRVSDNNWQQINKVCPHCSEADHTVIGVHGERAKCERTAKCVNCNQPHNSFSKECVIYKKEYAIQTIRITRKVSFFEARKIYSRENLETIYAKTVKNCTCVCNCTRSNEKTQGTTIKSKGKIHNIRNFCIKYPDGNIKCHQKDESKMSLLPKNISKRKQRQLANEEKRKKNKEGESSENSNPGKSTHFIKPINLSDSDE